MPYERGLPAHDTLNDVISAVDPGLFADCFTTWVETLRDKEPDITAIDGKTSRRSHARARGREPLHLVSAWAARQRLVLGQHAKRGLTGEGLDMVCVDGGKGLIAALPNVLPAIRVQRCWAHKIRNVLNKARKADQPKLKRALHAVMNAPNLAAARAAARRFADRFEDIYAAAVACLRNDLDELLTGFRYKSEDRRRAVRTTNAIERRFRAVRRRTRPMGTFHDKTSKDRELFAVFTNENKSQGVSAPCLVTLNN